MISKHRKLVSAGAGLLAFTAVLTGCSASTPSDDAEAAPTTIRLGLAPDEDSAEVLAKYQPFVDYLAEATGLEVEPFVGADYTAVIEALNSGNLDVAWFGPSEYVLATSAVEGGVEAFASAIQADDTVPYRADLIARADSGIEGPDDFEGKILSFTDPASTSGHIFARYAMIEDGIEPEETFSQVVYSGSHDASLLSVVNGQVDVAAISSRRLAGYIEEGMVEADEIVTVLESEEIPADPITYRADLDDETKQKLKDAFLTGSVEMEAALDGTGFAMFDEVSDADYDLVRDAYEATGMEPEL